MGQLWLSFNPTYVHIQGPDFLAFHVQMEWAPTKTIVAHTPHRITAFTSVIFTFLFSIPVTSTPSGETANLDNPKIYVLSSIILLTLLGNGYVFFSIVSRARKTAYSYNGKMTRMYYFMLHLSSADILTALLTLLSELIWTFTSPDFYGGNVVCKAVKFLQMIGPYLR